MKVTFWSKPGHRPLRQAPRPTLLAVKTIAQPRLRLPTLGRFLAVGTAIAMAGFALFGPTGVIVWKDYEQELSRKRQQLSDLQRQESILRNRAALLRPGAADPDVVDELVRKNLGVAHPDDVIVPLD